ncbi:LANO_0F05292g1_1 [Lachancea nothofagi CBS 11611]|uniref:LANO_0F05292g1_1 n=1 Tax=Lachancea nothofagi CBS 11611 TaxID=1266666 RepID=A0A1G4K857_9SACH|nr:LANO_0F05292g1_1 [Lachancea nothofagi CBS 11611]
MKFSSVVCSFVILPVLSIASVSIETSVSCGTIATGGVLESTPYSSSTATILEKGTEVVGIYHFYRSVTYVSDCNPSTRVATDVNPTITIY